MHKLILKGMRPVAVFLTALGAICALLMMVHVSADVIGRFVFHRPVHATLEVVEHIYMVCLAFLPVAMIQLDREHLLIELFIADAHSRIGRVATLIGSLIAFSMSALIGWKTFEIAIEKTRIDEVLYLVDSFLPVWPVRWVIALAFVFSSIVLIAQIIEDILALGKPRATEAGPAYGPGSTETE